MISRKSLSELEQAIVQVMQGAPKEEEQKTEVAEDTEIEEAMAAGAIHPMALHVKPVQKDGKQMYHVHAVGKKLGGGIKKGEHLSDTELDDASEMGAKIKHMKEEEEQIDEISKSTLGSYVKKASLDMANRSAEVEKDLATAKSDYSMMRRHGYKKNVAQNMMKKDVDTALSKVGKVSKRLGGIEKATDRLAKEEVEEVDFTVIDHKGLEVQLPESLNYNDYLNAAKKYTEKDEEAVAIADEFFKEQDESLVIEAFTRGDVEAKINAHAKAGHQVGLPKYSTKDGKPYAEYTVTNKETGQKTKYIHHGTTRRVERM